ncbi:hypothetical protein [Aerococcus sp. HMSC062A02]|uniref:hypothetical protein n=1 Tax=Aerococcus sp. HMSC062A02 TaxID=1715105 RepID=UPI00114C9202|nr:hypothetical protein [Aerococcus sp. HMSC062A02]
MNLIFTLQVSNERSIKYRICDNLVEATWDDNQLLFDLNDIEEGKQYTAPYPVVNVFDNSIEFIDYIRSSDDTGQEIERVDDPSELSGEKAIFEEVPNIPRDDNKLLLTEIRQENKELKDQLTKNNELLKAILSQLKG